MLASSFFWKQQSCETVILRPVHILGGVRNAPSNYLRLPWVPTLLGFDPMVQVIHELDVVESIVRALTPGVRGIFNVVGPGEVPLSTILRELEQADRADPAPAGPRRPDHAVARQADVVPRARARPHPLRLHGRRHARPRTTWRSSRVTPSRRPFAPSTTADTGAPLSGKRQAASLQRIRDRERVDTRCL